MRKRLTKEGLFRRTAAPDEFSGRNMNTPITLYDTHPNKRFPVGSTVTFVDDKFLRLRGTVLGHAAEDRLWVQWPNEVRQMDTDEVVGNNEIQEAEPASSAAVTGSRGSRKAALITFDDLNRWKNERDEEDEDLEYIPDEPDFQDGDPVVTDDSPTNEVHTGELPSEQDPRDKVEEDDENEGECESFGIILTFPEVGDMTELIEDRISAARKAAPTSWTGLAGQMLGQAGNKLTQWGQKTSEMAKNRRDRQTKYYNDIMKERYGKDYLKFNAFNQPEVQTLLKRYGLSDQEIRDYANIRQEHLDQAAEMATGSSTTYQWGHGLGQTATASGSAPASKEFGKWPEQWPPGGARVWYGAQLPKASRSLGKMRNHVNLVRGLLAMPRTADAISQTADLVSAVREIDDGKPLDETTKSALRNTSRNLLTAMDHLKSVNNRIANRVAGEIEQLYVDALSA